MAKDLIIKRIFNATKGIVWKAWTDPEYVKKWWGPKNFTSPVVKMDFRKGGKYLCCMRSPEGKDYWSTGTYKEIVYFEKIIYTDSFADESGNIVHASYYDDMSKDFPMEMQVTVSFEDDTEGTKMTLRHSGLPQDMIEMCRQGWSESFDKLEESIAHPRMNATDAKSDAKTKLSAEP